MNKAHLLPFLLLGWIFVVMAFIGVFLPIWPTTPFALLAAYFFSKGSPRLYAWLISIPKLGSAVEDWNEFGVISTKAKILASVALIFVIGKINFYGQIVLWVRILVTSILSLVFLFINTRPGKRG